jgi:hypothetical protein
MTIELTRPLGMSVYRVTTCTLPKTKRAFRLVFVGADRVSTRTPASTYVIREAI